VVTRIESAIEHEDIDLEAFLYIEAAFDSTLFDIIKQAAERHGIEPAICRWICDMLESRRDPGSVCGQGASAVRCAFASAVEPDCGRSLGTKGNGHYTVGYADDIAIFISGKFLQTVSALCTVQQRCERTKLSINPKKTVIIPFTRKRRPHLETCIHVSIYGFTALVDLDRFLSFLFYTQSVGPLDGGTARRKAATYTQKNTNTELTHTDIHASSEIRTHDPSVRAGEDGSCLSPRGHCDRHVHI
jgi:hypothetical protein